MSWSAWLPTCLLASKHRFWQRHWLLGTTTTEYKDLTGYFRGARVRSLASLARHLPPGLLPQALAFATAITNNYSRALALTALAPHLPSDQRADVLTQALAAANAISDSAARALSLGRLAPRLPTEQQADVLVQALAATAAITDRHDRADTLTVLAPHLLVELLAEALTLTPEESIHTITALLTRGVALARSDENAAVVDLLRNCLGTTSRHACLSIITAAAPAIAEVGGPGAIQQCGEAIADMHRWWP
jgi:hypothetical protein